MLYEGLLVVPHSIFVYTLQERCAQPSGEALQLQTRSVTVLQCGVGLRPRASIHIEKKVLNQRRKRTQAKTHKPRARRPSPTAVVFRYTICGRALLRYSNVAARNTRRSVSQPVYTRRSHASEDARAAMRRAMRRPGRASASRAQRLLLQIRRRDGYVQAGRGRRTDMVRS